MSSAIITSFLSNQVSTFSYATSFFVALFIFVKFYYSNKFKFFQKIGLKNPPPFLIVGNLASLLGDRMKIEREWNRLYGNLYGVFFGGKPRYIVADPEVLRQLCIKDFDAMPNHDVGSFANKYQKNFIFNLKDDRWRRIRALQSPTFTSGKIKRMYLLLDKCADDLVQVFAERLEEGKLKLTDSNKTIVNLKEIYGLYTMDAIASAAYQIKLQREGSSSIKTAATRNHFVGLVTKLFDFGFHRLIISFTVPEWFLKLIGFEIIPERNMIEIAKRVELIIKQRRESSKKFDDYLQLLIDAKLDDKLELNEMDDKENHHAGLTSNSLQTDQENMVQKVSGLADSKMNGSSSLTKVENTKVALTDPELISSAIFLFLVGLETTATLLTSCTYSLAFHQDIQQRLYEAVKSIATFDEQTQAHVFDYESLTSCQYLDAVISESLRILAPVISLDRLVNRDYHIEKYNVSLKKGDKLQLAYYAVMNNPEFWPEPLKFDPERFMPENKSKIVPGSYCPFGLGPRHCIGMRFSLTEAKLALAKVLMKFKFLPAPNTSFPPKSRRHITLNSINPAIAQLLPREV